MGLLTWASVGFTPAGYASAGTTPTVGECGLGRWVALSGFAVLGGHGGRIGEDPAESFELLDAGKVDRDTAASSARLGDIDEGS
jgi:hypothetical protein